MKRLKRLGQKGQASLFIGMMLMTFILFFAFVVNTGMLINAKINLQNATDLAAYSGAATQARLLNDISFLNYEMRRTYKKFMFRYYVLGNMAQVPFPRGGGQGAMKWSPDGTRDYGVPVVCIVFNQNDNFCQLAALPKLSIPPANPLDAISGVLNQQLTAIEKIRVENCKQIGFTNTLLLAMWLFNPDPSFKSLATTIGSSTAGSKILPVIKGLAEGLGVVPKEFLLRQRIQTLADFVNEAPIKALNLEAANALKTSGDPMAKERSINAFFSAFNTLGDNIFDGESLTIEELMPRGTDGANLLKLNDIRAPFDAWALDLDDTSGDCLPSHIAYSTPGTGLIVGVYKDPTVLTYYAIRARAKAKVMFSPFGDMELTAYAAARPFGSRIGPALTEEMVTRPGQALFGPTSATTGLNGVKGRIPNLPILAEDSAGAGQGWDKKEIMGGLFKAMNAAAKTDVNMENYIRGYHAAMSPNPWEGNRYNIPNDTANDPFVVNFDGGQDLVLYAPLFTTEKQATMIDSLKSAVQSFLQPPSGGKNAAQVADPFDGKLPDLIGQYIQSLAQSPGEGGETIKTYRISNPLVTRPRDPMTGGTPKPISVPGYTLSNPKELRTSFSAVNSSDLGALGRVGYSVKFVTFDSLRNPNTQMSSVSSGTPANPPDSGTEDEAEFDYLKH